MKTYGNPPVHEPRPHVEHTRATDENLDVVREAGLQKRRRKDISGFTERDVANIRRWREDNPNSVGRWDTKYGTCAAWGGFKMYYGTCQDCGCLVTARRPSWGNQGRWPKYCQTCRERQAQEHDNKARGRMRRRRAEGRAEAERIQRDRAERELERIIVRREGGWYTP
ncbi:Uncharacterised protein [Mycobacteroides abscessus subsp. bolletii]|nr:Uncharacterised protein [Mycobacteroides abscessus subsp. bolletii]